MRVPGVGSDASAGAGLYELAVIRAGDERHDGQFGAEPFGAQREADGDGIKDLAPVSLVALAPAVIASASARVTCVRGSSRIGVRNSSVP